MYRHLGAGGSLRKVIKSENVSSELRENEKVRNSLIRNSTFVFILLGRMASSSTKTDAAYIALLGLAENFRTSNPPNIRLSIHCLQGILNVKPGVKAEARTHLQIGNLLLAHTKNQRLAISHLEKAVRSTFCSLHCRWINMRVDLQG